MKNCWELFPELYARIKTEHELQPAGHHPFQHDVTVAQYAILIAPDERTAIKAAAAALCHSWDRLHPDASDQCIAADILTLLKTYTGLSELDLSSGEVAS